MSAAAGPIGRQAEVTEIRGLLDGAGPPLAIVIAGDAGIGKTVVWNHVVQDASRCCRVLSCRPGPAETRLAFSGLDDLFGEILGQVLPALPPARRQALATALLQGSDAGQPPGAGGGSGRPPPDQRVLARGVLDALRILSRDTRLVLAVDDVQWLDRASASVLEFCVRRMDREAVSMLLTVRSPHLVLPLGLDRDVPPGRVTGVLLGPMEQGAIGEIVRSRLGVTFPRYVLHRLCEAGGGNPFYAIESGRALLAGGGTFLAGDPVPVPPGISELVRHRLRGLTGDSLLVGQLLAASSDKREEVIRAAFGDEDSWVSVDQAVDDGIIERNAGVLRFTHPVLGSVLYAEMTMSQRRIVHGRLGLGARNAEERAWHLALAAEGPCEEIALGLDAAARHAAARGAPETAAALAEQAMRLTPGGRPEAARARTAHAADHHFRAGEIARSRELTESALAGCPPGSLRASLLIRLAIAHYHQSGWTLAEPLLCEAAGEAAGDPALRAHAEQELALARLMAGDLRGASRWAAVSLRSAERAASPRLVAHSLARTAVFEFLQGNHVRLDLMKTAESLDASAGEEPVERLALFGPSLVRGVILKWCDRLDDARQWFADCYRHALDHGDEASLPFLLYHFSELECWAGNWATAVEYALEGCRVARENHQETMRAAALYALALVRAHLGEAEEARDCATEALTCCEQTGNVPLTTSVLSVLGFIALSAGDNHAAHAHLERVARMTATLGLGEPGVVKFLPDEIEALIALGEVGLAHTYTRQLQEAGTSRGRAWALAAAARCRAQLAGREGDYEGAQTACKEALMEHARLPMPFELGRTLLVKGMIERRAKCKSAAGESLAQALSIFERLGAELWAGKTRQELSAISARPLAGGLTETQHRVAALVARGQTNREIAAAMFVTQNTVQTHIRHIFQKLGVRSRTELAARLLSPAAAPVTSGSGTATIAQ
jgi:DNA-binding CsgD family transcriptional regulator/tetratricopeptide (TPR) repeat protein